MTLRDLFENNRQWAESVRRKTPDFFAGLCSQQFPTYLWIGCSDSRVPANTIVGLDPGELFVHRNLGNVVTDAAVSNTEVGLADSWIRHIKDVKDQHCVDLAQIDDEGSRADRRCEFNVMAQARNVCQTTVVRDAWRRGEELVVHGWIYRLTDGLLRDLDVSVGSHDQLAAHFRDRIHLSGRSQWNRALHRSWYGGADSEIDSRRPGESFVVMAGQSRGLDPAT